MTTDRLISSVHAFSDFAADRFRDNVMDSASLRALLASAQSRQPSVKHDTLPQAERGISNCASQ
ncbi:MAG: hypothetical protein OXI60_09370 [Acidiferrobacterales bacterium]|nr:hypothetical protein [Acidiferrobacterales bacterium]